MSEYVPLKEFLEMKHKLSVIEKKLYQSNKERSNFEKVLDQETARRIAAEEALKFYADLENFGKVVWENDERDKRCWTEPFDSYEITEIYAEHDTGDFGIKAEEHLAKYAEEG